MRRLNNVCVFHQYSLARSSHKHRHAHERNNTIATHKSHKILDIHNFFFQCIGTIAIWLACWKSLVVCCVCVYVAVAVSVCASASVCMCVCFYRWVCVFVRVSCCSCCLLIHFSNTGCSCWTLRLFSLFCCQLHSSSSSFSFFHFVFSRSLALSVLFFLISERTIRIVRSVGCMLDVRFHRSGWLFISNCFFNMLLRSSLSQFTCFFMLQTYNGNANMRCVVCVACKSNNNMFLLQVSSYTSPAAFGTSHSFATSETVVLATESTNIARHYHHLQFKIITYDTSNLFKYKRFSG